MSSLRVPRRFGPPRLKGRGVDHKNLRSLRHVNRLVKDVIPTKLALTNARSVVNKTFILNDFITTNDLDFFFISETWLKVGDLSPLSELLPEGYVYLNSPRPSGRGGGLMTIYKKSTHCKLLTVEPPKSFELQLFQIVATNPVTVALIYRPPKPNRVFIQEFSDLLSALSTNCDCFLLLGDFNVHICCANDTLSSEFLNVTESFDLTQWVKSPTHKLGHTLDLILTHNLQIDDVNICETNFSDHMPIIFKTTTAILPLSQEEPKRWSRKLSSTSNEDFSALFKTKSNTSMLETSLQHLDVDEHWTLLNSTCIDILDTIAPLRPISNKTKTNPWLNDNTRDLRKQCRRNERKWKKANYKLITMFLEILYLDTKEQ